MLKRLLKLTLLTQLVWLAACGKKMQTEDSCNFVQNVYGERIAWHDEVPVEIYLHSSFPQKFIVSLENAFAHFENVMGRPMFKLMGYDQGPLQPRQDGKSIIYWMPTWEPEKMSEQARTSVYWVGEQIKEADIRINDQKFNFFIDAPQAGSSSVDIHLESLLIHELGHVLGLKHNDENNSVMATYLAGNTVRNELSPTDIDSLRCEY